MTNLDTRQDAREIAESLSRYERRTLLNSLNAETDRATRPMMQKLRAKGLLDNGFWLNDLGLAVRRILQEQSK